MKGKAQLQHWSTTLPKSRRYPDNRVEGACSPTAFIQWSVVNVMIKRKVNSQGFTLLWNVPENPAEYDALAPKRDQPCLEDATLSTWYRSGAPKWRDKLCELVENVTKVERINEGTTDEPKWEKEGVYIKRAFAEYAKAKGLDPAAPTSRDSIIAELTPAAQVLLDGIRFDPSEKEGTSGGPALAKTYMEWAKIAVKKDGGVRLAAMLAKLLNTTITLPAAGTVELTGDEKQDAEIVEKNNEPVVKALATAIAANEKRKRDEQLRAAKAEYELEGVES
jgi:hypothetical protein